MARFVCHNPRLWIGGVEITNLLAGPVVLTREELPVAAAPEVLDYGEWRPATAADIQALAERWADREILRSLGISPDPASDLPADTGEAAVGAATSDS